MANTFETEEELALEEELHEAGKAGGGRPGVAAPRMAAARSHIAEFE